MRFPTGRIWQASSLQTCWPILFGLANCLLVEEPSQALGKRLTSAFLPAISGSADRPA